MADSTRTDDKTRDEKARSSSTGEQQTGDARQHATNARVAQLRGGLEKAVTGREELIKTKAVEFAEKIDERTGGRHHQKLRVALMVVEFVVDRVGGSSAAGTTSGDTDSKRAHGTTSTGPTRGAAEEPEQLGEFRNMSDR
ncbi:hypothetical protein F8O01_08035 [Pseudoclavibacter chungangensis]|uniref:Uncharacterized protein n=1 Tax=Pseudoclavibacter chungangensis TaxID=587635 RepID=A0A7J5BWF7_9MICO|nr:hypothetical protein [Pseudoclavibacter chungangensis]KAB1657880.1 hypothetical protein F8O01_08035 [Pseudoclavibacter chungangensis]NYJ66516.1 hypothetical protein [Pseudoclavibacter chungangensis]